MKLENVFKEWIDRLDHPIVAVETGCSFMWGDKFLPYISTLNIAKHLVEPTQGKMYSLDIDEERITMCAEELTKIDLIKYVELVVGDSVSTMNDFIFYDVNFVWLDSSEDADHAMAEYESIKPALAKKHIVCVDDYGCPNSVKWQGVSNLIKNEFKEHKTYDTPTGLIVGYNE